MIQLNSLQLSQQGSQFYSLSFNRIHFTLIDAPNLKYLQYFSRQNQTSLGKILVKLQIDELINYSHFFKETNYILMTQYQQILFLPYFLKQFPQIKIIATNLMYELARIHISAFQQKIKDVNATAENISYDEEMDIRDIYQRKFGIDLSNGPQIFSQKEVQSTLSKIIKVNYQQVYDTERGVSLVAYASGKNNGSCFWQVESQTTKEKLLLINQISQHQWRTCQSYNLNKLQNSQDKKSFDHIIFTKKGLSNLKNQGQQVRMSQYITKLTNNMFNSINTIIVLSDQTTVIDLIPRISFQPQGKCQALFFSHPSLHDFINYCNSYVDYLSDHFKNVIFSESPDYPFVHYSRSRQKGFININNLQQSAIKMKLPVKEIVLQNNPFIFFVKNYQHYLQTQDLSSIYEYSNQVVDIVQINIQNNFTKTRLQKFISCFPKAKIYAFGTQLDSSRIVSLNLNAKHKIGQSSHPYYLKASNLTSNRIHKFRLRNNQLQLKSLQNQIIYMPKMLIDHIFNELVKKGIIIIQKDRSMIRTSNTSVVLSEDYKLKVISSHVDQLLLIQRLISGMILPTSVF